MAFGFDIDNVVTLDMCEHLHILRTLVFYSPLVGEIFCIEQYRVIKPSKIYEVPRNR